MSGIFWRDFILRRQASAVRTPPGTASVLRGVVYQPKANPPAPARRASSGGCLRVFPSWSCDVGDASGAGMLDGTAATSEVGMDANALAATMRSHEASMALSRSL